MWDIQDTLDGPRCLLNAPVWERTPTVGTSPTAGNHPLPSLEAQDMAVEPRSTQARKSGQKAQVSARNTAEGVT